MLFRSIRGTHHFGHRLIEHIGQRAQLPHTRPAIRELGSEKMETAQSPFRFPKPNALDLTELIENITRLRHAQPFVDKSLA